MGPNRERQVMRTTVCWRGDWSSAECASCSSITPTGTTTQTLAGRSTSGLLSTDGPAAAKAIAANGLEHVVFDAASPPGLPESAELAAAKGGAKLVTKDELLARSDVVSIHLVPAIL